MTPPAGGTMSPIQKEFEETTKALDHLYTQLSDGTQTSGWDTQVVSQIKDNVITARDSLKNGLEVMRQSGGAGNN